MKVVGFLDVASVGATEHRGKHSSTINMDLTLVSDGAVERTDQTLHRADRTKDSGKSRDIYISDEDVIHMVC